MSPQDPHWLKFRDELVDLASEGDHDWLDHEDVRSVLGDAYRKKFIEERELTVIIVIEDTLSLQFGSGRLQAPPPRRTRRPRRKPPLRRFAATNRGATPSPAG